MRYRRIYSAVSRGTVFGCLFLAMLAASAQSEPRYDMHDDQVPYNSLEFDGVLENTYANTAEAGTKVLINDAVYFLRPDAIFRNRYGNLVGMSSFQSGMTVGFYVLESNQIAKMWEIIDEEQSSAPAQTRPQPSSGATSGDEIRLEDGVWRN